MSKTFKEKQENLRHFYDAVCENYLDLLSSSKKNLPEVHYEHEGSVLSVSHSTVDSVVELVKLLRLPQQEQGQRHSISFIFLPTYAGKGLILFNVLAEYKGTLCYGDETSIEDLCFSVHDHLHHPVIPSHRLLPKLDISLSGAQKKGFIRVDKSYNHATGTVNISIRQVSWKAKA